MFRYSGFTMHGPRRGCVGRHAVGRFRHADGESSGPAVRLPAGSDGTAVRASDYSHKQRRLAPNSATATDRSCAFGLCGHALLRFLRADSDGAERRLRDHFF